MLQYIKIIKEVGYPIFVSLILFWLLIWLIKFMLRHFADDVNLLEKNADTLDSIKQVTQTIWEKLLKNSGGGR